MSMELSKPLRTFHSSGYPIPRRQNNNYIVRKFTSNTEKLSFKCEICNMKATSNKVLQRHLEGKKHKTRAEKQGKDFRCEICNVVTNGQKQLESHMNGWRHKLEVERKEHPEKFIRHDGAGGIIICIIVVCLFINFLVIFRMFL